MRRRVRFEMVLGGREPEREEAGRRRAVTRLFSHWTPAQLHGVGFEVFQRKVRPPTEERRDKRAARSEVRSEEVEGMRKEWKRTKNSSSIAGFGEKDCIFFVFWFWTFRWCYCVFLWVC